MLLTIFIWFFIIFFSIVVMFQIFFEQKLKLDSGRNMNWILRLFRIGSVARQHSSSGFSYCVFLSHKKNSHIFQQWIIIYCVCSFLFECVGVFTIYSNSVLYDFRRLHCIDPWRVRFVHSYDRKFITNISIFVRFDLVFVFWAHSCSSDGMVALRVSLCRARKST